jgi:hypothetical protein
MKNPLFLFWSVLMLFLTNSCNLDSLDFDKLSGEVNLNPEIVAPIAKANISVWDLMQAANKENTDLISKDTNGLIKIMYRQNDLFRYNLRDLMSFPVQESFSSGDKPLGELQPGAVSVACNITLTDLVNLLGLTNVGHYSGQTVPFLAFSFNGPYVSIKVDQIPDFTTITLSKGTLEITMENKLKVPVTVKGSLYDLVYNRKIKDDFQFTNIAPNSTSKVSLDLTGLQISNKVEFRMLTFDTPGSTSPVYINPLDFFKLTFDVKNAGVSKGNLLVKAQTLGGSSGTVSFTIPEPDLKAYSTVMKKGTMSIKTNNTSKVTGSINLTLPEIKKSGVPITANIPLNGSSIQVDLAGANFNFASDPLLPYNRIPYSYNIQVNASTGFIDYVSTDVIRVDMSLTNLEFKSVHGDFGKQQIVIDQGKFDMDVDMLDKLEGSFKLSNPKLELIFRNSIGMPASVAVNLIGKNKSGQQVALTRTPSLFDLPVPANINAGIATGSMIFDKQNSNIISFVALPPTGEISYSGKAEFNKNNTVTPQNPNFLDLDATFAIDALMELPIELQVSSLTFKDTTAVSGGDFDDLESADLIINAKNGIPLDVEVQLFFIDTISKSQFGFTKKLKVLTAAQVNGTGVITPTNSTQTLSLDATEMNSLKMANGIVFSGSVTSPSGGTGVASLYSDSKIDLNVVIKSKVKL